MAYTKIHPIKSTLHKAIDYICNPEKTDGKLLVDCYGCSQETAAFDFRSALQHTSDAGKNLAFHLIQSFLPGETTPEQAHKIGQEMADRLLAGKYSYVLTTHIDKGHLHNHLIFCAADNINYERYYDTKASYRNIRHISDQLCEENGLSVIPPSYNRSMTYKEWESIQSGTSWKIALKSAIDQCVKLADSFEEFSVMLKMQGFEVSNRKYLSFQVTGEKHFIWGKTLGDNYTKEAIFRRLTISRSRSKQPRTKPGIQQLLTKYSNPELYENPGLQKWANKENLKRAAQSFLQLQEMNLSSFEELDDKIIKNQEQKKLLHASIRQLEAELKSQGELIKYVEQYRKNQPIHAAYKKAFFPDRYFRAHESQLILYDAACRVLTEKKIRPEKANIQEMRDTYNALFNRKEALNKNLHSLDEENKTLRTIHDNLSQYLDILPDSTRLEPSIPAPSKRDL